MKNPFLLAFATTFVVAALIPAAAQADLRLATLRHDSMVYRQANEGSQILGKLRDGKTVKVYYPERNGWYAVAFAQPIQGARYGWVHAEDVDVGETVSGGKGASGGRYVRLKKNWLDLGLDLRQTAPSLYQDGIGEAESSFWTKSFSLEYGHHFNSRVGIAFRGFYYSWTKATAGNTTTGQAINGNYSANGYGVTAGLDLLLVSSPSFQLALDAGLGLSLNSAQNSSSTDGFLTTNIMAIPIYAEVKLRKFFGTSPLGFSLGAGYEIMSLSQVPILLPNGSPNPGAADEKLGGLYVHFGLCLQM